MFSVFRARCCIFTVISIPNAIYIWTKYSQLIWLRFKQLAWHPSHEGSAENKFIFIFSFITLVINQCCALSELRLNKHNPTQPMKTAAQNVFCVFLLHFSVCFTQKMSFSCNLMDNKVFLSRTFLKITCLTSHPLMNLLCSTVKTNRNFSNGDLKNNLSVWEVKLNKLASKHTSLVISVSHFLVKWSSYHYNCFKCE